MKRKSMLFIVICVMFVLMNACDETVYVHVNGTTGNDSTGERGNPNKPFKTIQKGIDVSVDLDIVLVADGIYNENIDFNGKAIVVKSESGPAKTTIRGTGVGDVVIGATDGTIQGFTITGSGNYWYDCGVQAKLATMTIRGNIIKSNWVGINTSNTNEPLIVNNIIYNNSHYGIVASYYSAPTIINNTVAFNGEHGIASQSGTGIVMNNLISFNGGNGIFCTFPESSPEISYNNVFGNQLGNFFSCLPGEGDISADPLFIDAVNNDYHLRNDSPCIGAGIMTPEVPDTDIERTPRPNPPGSYPDMGACEYPSFSPPLNFIGQKVLNRSLSQIEYINKLNWQSNPDNADLNILNYRIYQLDEMGISLLVELDANTFEYWHRDIDNYEEYNYAICAVIDDGSESIRSFVTVE